MSNAYAQPYPIPVSQTDVDTRAVFITRTYTHLLGAIIAFTCIEVALFKMGLAVPIAQAMLSVSWMIPLGAFMLVSWIASRAAHRAESLGVQYAAWAGMILAQSFIFVPLLVLATIYGGNVIQSAAIVTMIGFACLTAIVVVSRKDFSFLGGLLKWGMVCAVIAIVAGAVFGFELGTWFSVGMVAFAGAAILYDTSRVLHHYPADRYVGASVELFASVALMFWYVLQLFMSRD
ncbi:MAG: Bax inhibitor-1/YccA family protein [Planctomycetota bacterium]